MSEETTTTVTMEELAEKIKQLEEDNATLKANLENTTKERDNARELYGKFLTKEPLKGSSNPVTLTPQEEFNEAIIGGILTEQVNRMCKIYGIKL